MKQAYKRWLAPLLCLLLAAAFGCSLIQKPGTSTGSDDSSVVFGIKDPDATPTPAPTPVLPANERFDAVDKAFFTDYVTSDWYTFRAFVKNPDTFGIDASAVPVTWGEFSEEKSRETLDRYEAWLAELSAIPREELDERRQFSCDVLSEYLENTVLEGRYEYYYEPLPTLTGFHSDLPIILGLYELDTESDLTEYLQLLADVPRYMNEILVYEQERAARGLFMTGEALDTVTGQCSAIIDARNDSFLLATFNEALDDIGGLSDDKKAQYREQNRQLVTGSFADAYAALRDGLEALRPSCRTAEGMYALGDDGINYFAARMQNEGSTLLDPADALQLLQDEMYNMIVAMSTIAMENPAALDDLEKDITTGDTAGDLDYLEKLSSGLLAPLPAHTLTVSEVPEELESQTSPAMYVIPAVDDWKDNEVLVNPAASTDTILFTLAHETYPGHLYQYVYQRALTDLSLSQRVMSLSGYAEAWSQMAVELFIERQAEFNRDQCTIQYDNSLVINTILPAIISIKVNYQGESLEDIESYLTTYGMQSIASVYYQHAIDSPFYFFRYALGYCQFAQMLRSAENDLGDAFDQGAYLMQYLNYGPAQMNILRERMDIWVDAQASD